MTATKTAPTRKNPAQHESITKVLPAVETPGDPFAQIDGQQRFLAGLHDEKEIDQLVDGLLNGQEQQGGTRAVESTDGYKINIVQFASPDLWQNYKVESGNLIVDHGEKSTFNAANLRTEGERIYVAEPREKQMQGSNITATREFEESTFTTNSKKLEEVSQKVDKELDKHCAQGSKWSGKTIVLSRDSMPGVAGRKEWNCDIVLREDSRLKTIIHEHLHARSISYYTPEVYISYQLLEEGAVELFAQEICIKNQADFKPSYIETVRRLRIINSITKIGDSYSFAKQLFDLPVTERYNWLRQKADDLILTGKLSSKTAQSLDDAVEYMRGRNQK